MVKPASQSPLSPPRCCSGLGCHPLTRTCKACKRDGTACKAGNDCCSSICKKGVCQSCGTPNGMACHSSSGKHHLSLA